MTENGLEGMRDDVTNQLMDIWTDISCFEFLSQLKNWNTNNQPKEDLKFAENMQITAAITESRQLQWRTCKQFYDGGCCVAVTLAELDWDNKMGILFQENESSEIMRQKLHHFW